MSTTDNKVHYDLTNVYVAPLTIDLDAGTVSFGTPERMHGAISMDLAAQGDVIRLRADAMDYYVTYGNNGYSGNLNLAMVPDWFRQEYLGNTLSEKDKVLVENAQAEHKPFAMLFEFLGDKNHRRHVLYNCTANRPNIKGENKENQKEADAESLALTSSPLPDGNVKASTTAETPTAVYEGWNKTVWVKDTTTS